MPRPKHGLGQGLEALVGPRHRSGPWPEHDPLTRRAVDAGPGAPQWEFAALTRRRTKAKRRKSRLSLIISHPDTRVKPRQQRLRGASLWSALGLMGVDGWELVGVRKRRFYFKRAVTV